MLSFGMLIFRVLEFCCVVINNVVHSILFCCWFWRMNDFKNKFSWGSFVHCFFVGVLELGWMKSRYMNTKNVNPHFCLKIYFVYVYLKNDLFNIYYICKFYQFWIIKLNIWKKIHASNNIYLNSIFETNYL